MRILIVNLMLHSSEHGLITRRPSNHHTMIYTLARGFKSLGHSVTLAAAEEYRPLMDDDPGFNIVWFKSFMPRIFSPVLLPCPRKFAIWLRKHRKDFDLILSSEVFSVPSLMCAVISPRKLLLWQEMSVYQNKFRRVPAKIWYGVIARLCMRHIPVVARSMEAYRFINRFMSNVSDEIVSHGADENLFVPHSRRKNRFVSVSQLIPRKRIDSIIHCFSELTAIPEYSDFRLDIVGDGPSRKELEHRASLLGIADKVTFHGFKYHSEWAHIADGAIAMLINTTQDLNMVTVSESIVNGTPLLMNGVPATAQEVKEKKLGIVKDDWGTKEMIESIERYDEFHSNCIRERQRLTNRGVASRLIEIARSMITLSVND